MRMGNGWEMGGAVRGYGQGAWVVGGMRTESPRKVDGNGREKRAATGGRSGIGRRTGDELSRRSGVPSWREIISHCIVANAVADTVIYSVANPEIAVCAAISFHWGCTVANSFFLILLKKNIVFFKRTGNGISHCSLATEGKCCTWWHFRIGR